MKKCISTAGRRGSTNFSIFRRHIIVQLIKVNSPAISYAYVHQLMTPTYHRSIEWVAVFYCIMYNWQGMTSIKGFQVLFLLHSFAHKSSSGGSNFRASGWYYYPRVPDSRFHPINESYRAIPSPPLHKLSLWACHSFRVQVTTTTNTKNSVQPVTFSLFWIISTATPYFTRRAYCCYSVPVVTTVRLRDANFQLSFPFYVIDEYCLEDIKGLIKLLLFRFLVLSCNSSALSVINLTNTPVTFYKVGLMNFTFKLKDFHHILFFSRQLNVEHTVLTWEEDLNFKNQQFVALMVVSVFWFKTIFVDFWIGALNGDGINRVKLIKRSRLNTVAVKWFKEWWQRLEFHRLIRKMYASDRSVIGCTSSISLNFDALALDGNIQIDTCKLIGKASVSLAHLSLGDERCHRCIPRFSDQSWAEWGIECNDAVHCCACSPARELRFCLFSFGFCCCFTTAVLSADCITRHAVAH